jgi:pilus assembly protein CpaF
LAGLTEAQAKTLTEHARRGDNLLNSGGTGSGKKILTNVRSSLIPDGDRILILEDVAELYIKEPHYISAEAQLDTHKSQTGFADFSRLSFATGRTESLLARFADRRRESFLMP